MKHNLRLLAVRVSHQVHSLGHRAEHGVHLVYFGALSTGFIDYHLVAIVCLVAGLAALLPAGGVE